MNTLSKYTYNCFVWKSRGKCLWKTVFRHMFACFLNQCVHSLIRSNVLRTAYFKQMCDKQRRAVFDCRKFPIKHHILFNSLQFEIVSHLGTLWFRRIKISIYQFQNEVHHFCCGCCYLLPSYSYVSADRWLVFIGLKSCVDEISNHIKISNCNEWINPHHLFSLSYFYFN